MFPTTRLSWSNPHHLRVSAHQIAGRWAKIQCEISRAGLQLRISISITQTPSRPTTEVCRTDPEPRQAAILLVLINSCELDEKKELANINPCFLCLQVLVPQPSQWLRDLPFRSSAKMVLPRELPTPFLPSSRALSARISSSTSTPEWPRTSASLTP